MSRRYRSILQIDAASFFLSISQQLIGYQSQSVRLEGFFSGGDLYVAISLAVIVARVLLDSDGVAATFSLIPFLGRIQGSWEFLGMLVFEHVFSWHPGRRFGCWILVSAFVDGDTAIWSLLPMRKRQARRLRRHSCTPGLRHSGTSPPLTSS